ncbi:MAG: TIR domain-containing protein [Lachnospiraceae bacterium]|nr:TIR domain-containing protein [Lachnospiraceae bacterium]
MEKKWYYDAFISYRHTETDSFVAKNLHKQLESFKLPGNVARRLSENDKEAKTRITRVFRDQEELPLVSNLADPIMEALGKSEFLIVICSPRLKESMWCKKEIETFISLRGREHVLLVLTEGEPSDSFPEELLYREETVTADDGSTVIRKVPAEPLAADVRGRSKKEILKKIKSEILRLAAPMFGCGYDDLRQRHREQKMRKVITLSLAGSAICLLFGLVSTTMALRIRRQNVQISEQLNEIEQQSEEIAMQAEEIEKQYAEAVRSNCISLAKESANLLEKGDRIAAIETALQAFPGGSNEDIPYTPQAAYALTESLNIYENNTKILPDRILEADTNINFMKISPEGSKIITVDDFKMLCVWDSRDGSKLTSFLLNMYLYHGEAAIAFINEDMFLYLTENGVSCFDINLGADIYQIDCEVVLEICYSKDIDRAVISTATGFLVISGQSGEVTASGSWQENENLMETEACAVMNADGTLFAASAASEEEQIIFVCETQTGAVYRRYNIANGSVKCMRFVDDILYVADNNRWEPGTSFLADLGGTVYACDLSQDNAVLWTYRNDKNWVNKIAMSSKEGSNYIICVSYEYAVVLDKRDGGYIENFDFGSEVVEIRNYIGRDAFMVFTRDGTWIHLNLDNMMAVVGLTFTDCNSTNVKSFGIGNDFYTTLPYLDKNVTLYRWAAGNNFETLCETKNRYSSAELSKDGKYLAVHSYSDEYNICVEMIDTETCEVLWRYLGDEYFVGMSFYSEEEALTLITSDGIIMFDYETGEQRALYEEDYSFGRYLRTDVSGRYVITKASGKLNVYDVVDGSLSYEIMGGEIISDSSAVAVSPSMKYLATSSKTTDSLQLYAVDALREGETECLCEVESINATYVENMFFNEREEYASGLTLYVVYKNGDIKIYGVDEQNQKLYEDGGLQDLHTCMTHSIQPENADYGVIVGDECAYLIEEADLTDFSNQGKITAHIDGFLAVDGNRNCIYLTDRTNIYRVNIYDETMLREEAERQLGIRK